MNKIWHLFFSWLTCFMLYAHNRQICMNDSLPFVVNIKTKIATLISFPSRSDQVALVTTAVALSPQPPPPIRQLPVSSQLSVP